MGNALKCFSPKDQEFPSLLSSSASMRTIKNKGKDEKSDLEVNDESLIHQQALAAAMLFHQYQQNGGTIDSIPPINRSASVYHSSPSTKKQGFPRSSSSGQRSRCDSPLQLHALVNQDLNVSGLETNHFVLVHGSGFGAWCWYKTITLLREGGFEVDAVDLTGSGVNSHDTNNITSLAQYVKPLIDVFEKLGDGNKVILVGHDFGGTCISYVMELFPSRVAKAVFVSAAMLTNGKSTLDLFIQQTTSDGLMQKAHVFSYGNGKEKHPTAVDLNRSLLQDILFNRSPAKDVVLASVSMRPMPFAPVLEKLSLSEANYGCVRRFYIKTDEDCAMPLEAQESVISMNPPEQVFQLKGSDHSPFLSKPQGLHKLLLEIARIPPKQLV